MNKTISEECLQKLPYGKFVRFDMKDWREVLVWRTKDVYGKRDVYEYYDPRTGDFLGYAPSP